MVRCSNVPVQYSSIYYVAQNVEIIYYIKLSSPCLSALLDPSTDYRRQSREANHFFSFIKCVQYKPH